jgi:hypothetical protein
MRPTFSATPVAPLRACYGESPLVGSVEVQVNWQLGLMIAVMRRWDKLREWIAVEREFLAWRWS